MVVKFRPTTRILLPIKISAHREGAWITGEWKVSAVKSPSSFSWYRRKKKLRHENR